MLWVVAVVFAVLSPILANRINRQILKEDLHPFIT